MPCLNKICQSIWKCWEETLGDVMAVKDLVRIILFLINAITVVFGLIITAVGVYVISQSKNEPLKDIETGNLVGCVAFILIIGILVFLIGSFGCFGSLTQNTRLINWYMLSIGIVALLQLICLVALLINKSKVRTTAEDAFKDSVENYYTKDAEDQMVNQRGVDAVQGALECCGFTGPGDFVNDTKPAVPDSCCQTEEVTWAACDDGAKSTLGCEVKLKDFINSVVTVAEVCLLFAVLFSVFSMLGACYVKRGTPQYNSL